MKSDREAVKAEPEESEPASGQPSGLRTYRGVKEAALALSMANKADVATGESSGSAYFVFIPNKDGSFAAHPVHNWFFFTPSVRYRYSLLLLYSYSNILSFFHLYLFSLFFSQLDFNSSFILVLLPSQSNISRMDFVLKTFSTG